MSRLDNEHFSRQHTNANKKLAPIRQKHCQEFKSLVLFKSSFEICSNRFIMAAVEDIDFEPPS